MKKSGLQNILSLLIPCILCWSITWFSISVFDDYGWTVFILVPFLLGFISTLIYATKRMVPRRKAWVNAFVALGIYCLGLLLFAFEGIICLVMASPIAIPFTWIGYFIASVILQKNLNANPAKTTLIVLFAVPLLFSFDQSLKPIERSVTTKITIAASPAEVWKNIIAFPKLNEPTEFIFKAGIAYPTDATIVGSGVGAVRHCNFSTGPFVEPITIWEENKLLAFSVTSQPAPMQEISFYNIHPKHLDGYWASQRGQFKLTELPNGHTLVEGTTFYINKIKPDFYWTIWSDYIVHTIHERVLHHIKKQSEQ